MEGFRDGGVDEGSREEEVKGGARGVEGSRRVCATGGCCCGARGRAKTGVCLLFLSRVVCELTCCVLSFLVSVVATTIIIIIGAAAAERRTGSVHLLSARRGLRAGDELPGGDAAPDHGHLPSLRRALQSAAQVSGEEEAVGEEELRGSVEEES